MTSKVKHQWQYRRHGDLPLARERCRLNLACMSRGIEILRVGLGNGFDLMAEMTADKTRVEYTLRSPHDDTIRTPLGVQEAHVLMQMLEARSRAGAA